MKDDGYLEERSETCLHEGFTKCKPSVKLLGIDNPEFTTQGDGRGGPAPPPVHIAKLNHAAIEAQDVDVLCRFYTKVLGFRKVSRPDLGFPGHWLKTAGFMLHIIGRDPTVPRTIDNWKGQYSTEPEAWFIRRNTHLAFEVDDFETTERSLRQHRVEYSRHVLPETEMRQLFLYDPEGHGIELGVHEDTRRYFAQHAEAPEP